MVYFFCFILFSAGMYGVLVNKNIIKLIVSLLIISYSINIFLVLCGFRRQADAPIIEPGNVITNIVDPLPQALVLVLMVISFAITALLVSVSLRLYEKFGTFNIDEMDKDKR